MNQLPQAHLTLGQRVSQAKRICLVTGFVLSAIFLLSASIVSRFQWHHANSMVHLWNQSSMSIKTQSMGIQIETLLHAKPPELAQPLVTQYFNRILLGQSKVLAIVLNDQNGHPWAMSASSAGRPFLNKLESLSANAASARSEHTQLSTLNQQPVWRVSERLEAQTHAQWELQVFYIMSDDKDIEQTLLLNTVLACLIGILMLVYLLQQLWKRQIAIPRTDWEQIGQQAAVGIWKSDQPSHTSHPLKRASHATVQRVYLRSNWLAWQRKKLLENASRIPSDGGSA